MMESSESFSCFDTRHANQNQNESGTSTIRNGNDVSIGNNDATNISVASYDMLEWRKSASPKKEFLLDPTTVSYEDFFRNYLLKNLPCMFSSNLTSEWASRLFWSNNVGETHEESGGDINFEFLFQTYGEAEVTAVNCEDPEYKEGYGARDCRDMTFKEFATYWKERVASNDDSSHPSPCLYLKDWHIVRYHKSIDDQVNMPYENPTYFQSDWLNEFWEEKNVDDFKFCYMGPKGSFTSFHADVYGSYSWSANIIGTKKWYIYPPGKELRFYDHKKKKLNFNWDDPGIEGDDYHEVIQHAGECIFVPSGWHHVVWNLTDAISINHNWFNGANLCYIWNVLHDALTEVENELEEFRDIPEFHEQCQLVLKANHGMNYETFFEILRFIYQNRLNITKKDVPSQQANFDLAAIRHVVCHHCTKDPCVQMHFADFLKEMVVELNHHSHSHNE